MARTKPPRNRKSITTSFRIDDTKGYLTFGFYDDEMKHPCEVFARVAKSGSTITGLLDGLSIMVSYALQYGMPTSEIVEALQGMRFVPMGMTNDKDVKNASSLCDYIAQKLKVYVDE